MALETPYRYVNVAGAWPGARIDGLLADDDGRLTLPPGPDEVRALVALSVNPADGIVGLVAAPDGTLYVSDPGGGRVLRVDPCDLRVQVLGCLDRATGDPAAPQCPRGLALGPRGTLLIADPPTARVLVVDRATGALLDVREEGFATPWALCVDLEDHLIVADSGGAGLRRFDADGVEDLPFAAATRKPRLGLKSVRALTLLPGGQIVALDQGGRGHVAVLDVHGKADRRATAAFSRLRAGSVVALAQSGATTWAVGPRGVAAVTDGLVAEREDPVAFGAAIHCDGRVLLVTSTAILVLAPGAKATHGTLVVPAPPGPQPWDRVRVILAEPLPPQTHLRVWTRADAAGPAPPPPAGGDDPEAPLPTVAGVWRAAPPDVLDVRPLLAEAEALWIAVEWHGDGSASPAVDDVRVDRMGRGWLDDLPHVLVGEQDDPLARLLALLASVYEDVAGDIDALPGRLDAAITPDRPDAPWLARLAGWVDVYPAPRLDEDERRALVAAAMAVHERRGTPQGIVDAVLRDVGVEVTIAEPAPAPAWPLGQSGTGLAFGSGLTSSPPGPPVLDTTAIVDRSWLIAPAERGWPLLGASAHRFCVIVPADALADPALRADIERVVEREKPAHTTYELEAAAANTVVGTTRVGVDQIVGRPEGELRLGCPDKLGSTSVLTGHHPTDPPTPGRVGKTTVIGASHPERT